MEEIEQLAQLELMNRLRALYKLNPEITAETMRIFDKYWLRLSRFNKEMLAKEWKLFDDEKKTI